MTFDGGDTPHSGDATTDRRVSTDANPVRIAVLAPATAEGDAFAAFADTHGFEIAFRGEPTYGDVARIGDVVAVVLVPDGPAESILGTLDAIRERTTRPVVLYSDDVEQATLEAFLAVDGTDYVHRDTDQSEVVLADRIRSVASHANLSEFHGLLERAVDQADVGITIADASAPDMPLIYMNDGFSRLTGYAAEDALGKNCRFLQGEDTDPETVSTIRAAIEANEPVDVEITNYTPDGTPFWNHLALSPVFDDTGELTHYFGFQHDVSDRKELEAELRTQNDRLETFASVLSHDLRNPLSVARGHLDDLTAESVAGESAAGESSGAEHTTDLDVAADGVDEHLESIDAALERIDDLITDVLALARDGQRVDETQTVSLEPVARYAWSMVETESLDLAVDAQDVVVRADRDRLVSVFENLFRNAVEHATDATTIWVTQTPDGFSVSDDGTGVPPAVRESIFERGYSSSDDGTGFGLAIVEAAADAHGWSVDVIESERGGAAFVFADVDVTYPAS